MTAAVAEVEVEPSEPRVVGSFTCRRCAKAIDGVDQVANLVARRRDDGPLLPPLVQWLVVCDGCVRPRERGYLRDLGPEEYHLPSLRLRSADRSALDLVAKGRVYRVPHQIRVMENKKPGAGDPQITHAGYRILKFGLIAWDPVPGRKQGAPGPTAWAYVTDDGKEWLRMEAAGELEEGDDDGEGS